MLNPGKLIIFQCQGDTSRASYLNGRTGNGAVDMATDTNASGTRWKVSFLGVINTRLNPALVTLECMGDADGPRYLDGRTGDGSVGLVSETGGVFTGTKWLLQDYGNYIVTLRCEGDAPGNRYLDGRTGDGSVGLAPSVGGIFTGTTWKFSYAP